MERLDKIIANRGIASRREVKELLRQGRVLVDGVPASAPDVKVSAETAAITVDGVPVSSERYTYLLLHKPAGVLTATEDKHQPTVMELLPESLRRRGLAPVGRLDKDTEGLLLLTDDGELTHRLLSPRYHVDKVNYAKVEGVPDAADAEAFADGLLLEDGLQCLPAKLEPLGGDACLVTLREGKFHQVKRMLASRGKPVRYLKRLSMGPLQLEDTLLPGQCRELSPVELAAVRSACML